MVRTPSTNPPDFITRGPYRKCPGTRSLSGLFRHDSGAVSIRSFEVSRWRGGHRSFSYGFSMEKAACVNSGPRWWEGRCSRVEGRKGPECVSNMMAANEPEGMFEEFGRRSTGHTGTRSAQSRTECESGTVRYRHQPFV
jgi:hypothetical protein